MPLDDRKQPVGVSDYQYFMLGGWIYTWVDLLEDVEGTSCRQLNGQRGQLDLVAEEVDVAAIDRQPVGVFVDGQLWVQIDGLEVLVNG